MVCVCLVVKLFTKCWLQAVVLASGLCCPVDDCMGGSSPQRLLRHFNDACSAASEKASRSVVVITTVRNQPGVDPNADRPAYKNLSPALRRAYEKFFEDIPIERRSGSGSGLIVRKRGFILTNSHVIENSERIEVRLYDGRRFPAVLHAVDMPSDLAVLKIEADDLPEARFGDSDRLRVGECVIAVGAPYELDYTCTFGHISALGRRNVMPGYDAEDLDFIQTDALISPGNSGGPLVDIRGDVIGINTLIQGMNTGIGFAVPATMAREIADQLIETRNCSRSWLGVELEDARPEGRCWGVGHSQGNGVVVRKVVSGTSGSREELQELDIITCLNQKRVSSIIDIHRYLRTVRIGGDLTLEVVRAGARLTIRIKALELPEVVGSNP